ncbi:MAG: phage tail sheath subtilisin-like domain-containing protein [Methanotrichaceae archaeon]|nr:phage tail sheath subtilisin-like domain-containing protein [Methanotrichaceae archaeon]
MPVSLTYPGVYIEEIASGVRTITGVSTSVTGFVGAAKRGPVNKAVRILSYSDFERRYGGLAERSEMSYAVRQFFLNGGSEAWIVRVAKDVYTAGRILKNAKGADVLEITAIDEGSFGNLIEVRVDYDVPNKASNFNLTFIRHPEGAKEASVTESFSNLSMNPEDARCVKKLVNDTSKFVTLKMFDVDITEKGTSKSAPLTKDGELLDVAEIVSSNKNQFRVSVNGSSPVTVQISEADLEGADAEARLSSLAAAIEDKVTAQSRGDPALEAFTVSVDVSSLVLTSGEGGKRSSVRVLPGERNDLSAGLFLGYQNGGAEVDAASVLRPAAVPLRGSLTSGEIGALESLPSAEKNRLKISLDGLGPDEITLGETAISGADLEEMLQNVAARIEKAVRDLNPSLPAYKGFECREVEGNKIMLISGTRGSGSSVAVFGPESKSIASDLQLLSGTDSERPQDVMLTGGAESDFDPEKGSVYKIFIDSRSDRKGIYALEEVDIFNLLCIPGISEPGILADAAAYCKERRAFLIADPPKGLSPDAMEKLVKSPALPKSEYAAVYYPWIEIPDPLNDGKLRAAPPSGTMAGVFARTDSSRGIWKAPAGTDAKLAGVQRVGYVLTDLENGVLNPRGVNCLRVFPVYGPVSWGARTLVGDDQMASEWKYVPIRRLALYIEESLFRGTQWVVFEPNDEPLWSQIRLNIGAFMHNLFRQGAFQGSSPKEAYFVKCDKDTTTQNDIDLGIVNILVGFAPLKPAEFVVIKIQQMAGQIQT